MRSEVHEEVLAFARSCALDVPFWCAEVCEGGWSLRRRRRRVHKGGDGFRGL